MRFHGYLDGFEQTFDSLEALRTWANDLIRRYPRLVGKTLKIHKAVLVGGSIAVYSGWPSHYREIVIGV